MSPVPPPPADDAAAPRYLRFVTALVLGAAITTAPVALGACGDDEPPQVDASVPPDGSGAVDGPLPPPDLPRAAVA
jgi:hypothetical protein